MGYKILPKLQTLLKYIKTDVLPFLGKVRDGFSGIAKNKNSPAVALGIAIKNMTVAFQNLFKSLSGNKATSGLSTLEQIAGALTTVANAITSVTNAISGATAWWNRDGFWQTGQFSIGGKKFDATPWTSRGTPTPTATTNPGKFVMPNNVGPTIKPSGFNGGQVTINLNGVIDAEGSRRAIEKVLQKSSLRTGSVVVNRKVFTP